MADDDEQQRADEMEALAAIYGEACVAAPNGRECTLTLPDPETQPQLVLRVLLPDAYPSQHPPVFELHSEFAPPGVLAEWAAELDMMFTPGEVVLYSWTELLRQRWAELTQQRQLQQQEEQAAAAAPDADSAQAAALAAALGRTQMLKQQASSERDAGPAPARELADAIQLAMAQVAETVVHGEPFTEKRSTFQAHLAPASSVQQVEAFIELLLQNNKIRAATHNIMAYRIERPDAPGAFLQDADDDGEDAAGGRLLHMLQLADCRNVVVVVSRWYGGVLLGPARFAHINNAARQLLDACGYIGGSSGDAGKKKGGKKK